MARNEHAIERIAMAPAAEHLQADSRRPAEDAAAPLRESVAGTREVVPSCDSEAIPAETALRKTSFEIARRRHRRQCVPAGQPQKRTYREAASLLAPSCVQRGGGSSRSFSNSGCFPGAQSSPMKGSVDVMPSHWLAHRRSG
jgi:hypothetical protein